jgi:hypothetical protein
MNYDREFQIRFEGEFYDNEPEGYGTFYNSASNQLTIGNFTNLFLLNKYVIRYSSVDKYIGEADKNLTPSGVGALNIYRGIIVYGEFWLNEVNGIGLVFNKEMMEYKGQMKNSRYEGVGVFRTKDYTYYGQFIKNNKQGFGSMEFSSGRSYEGEFTNNSIGIYGRYLTNDFEYSGQFLNSQLNGYGSLVGKIGQYEGQFKNGKIFGFGRLNLFTSDLWLEGFWSEDNENIQKFLYNWEICVI